MADFDKAYNNTEVFEGGYANNHADLGGETWKGIARKMNPKWEGWIIIDQYKKKPNFPDILHDSKELQSETLNFFRINYWNILKLDHLNNQQMANEIYDTGVNMGTGRAALFFQRVLNTLPKITLSLDGKIGPKTINAFNTLTKKDQFIMWKLFNCLQGEKYITICESNPSQKVFIRGWALRVFEN